MVLSSGKVTASPVGGAGLGLVVMMGVESQKPAARLMKMPSLLACAVMAAGLFAFQGQTLAQVNIPGSVDPSRAPDAPIDEPEEDDFEFSFSIELDGGQTPAPGTEEDELDFEGLTVIGSSIYSQEELRPLWQELEGETITFKQLFDLTAAVSGKYKSDGYETSYAFFEPQETEDGVFTLTVIEGYIGEVDVEGDLDAAPAIRLLLSGLMDQKPIKTAEFERVALLVNDIPGVRGTLVLGPSSAGPGASRVVMKVTHDPWSGTFAFNNQGTKFAGKRQTSGSFTYNSLFGYGESLTVSGSLADPIDARRESQSISFSGALPVTKDGRVLSGTLSFSESVPGHTLSSLGIQSSSRSLNLGYKVPLKRSRAENLSINVDLQVLESRTISGRNTATEAEVSEDSIRAVTVTADYQKSNWFELGGITSASVGVTQSLHRILGGSEPADSLVTRGDADRDYSLLKGSITHIQPLDPGWSALFTAQGQIARTPLFSTHEFGVGGQGIGRAFDASEITGDNGLAALAEIRYNLPGEWLDELHEDWRVWMPSAQSYAFYDAGTTHNINTNNNGETQEALQSAGFGLRTTLRYNASFNVEVVKPLVGVVASQGNSTSPRMFMHLNWAF